VSDGRGLSGHAEWAPDRASGPWRAGRRTTGAGEGEGGGAVVPQVDGGPDASRPPDDR